MEREQLIKNAQILYPDLSTFYIELIVDDYIKRPKFYNEMYNGNIELPLPLKRDTKEDIEMNKNYINVIERDSDECNI